MNEELKISRRYLDELIDFESKKTVGKVMKRCETISDRETLKLQLKELVYEQFRDFKDLFLAYQHGYEVSVYKFTNKK
ncbi:MAG: hypothetical protein BWY21_00739 [Parcubacteria group bacterium ADurb.Bin216]|nr:MAG: hypothetical protein BWY21_00739 [Parcubacteria group bacterium ADurb.Bin216]